MRTAEEILRSGIGLIPILILPDNQRTAICQAINEARKETIEECAERAKSEWLRYGTHMGHFVTHKLKILNY